MSSPSTSASGSASFPASREQRGHALARQSSALSPLQPGDSRERTLRPPGPHRDPPPPGRMPHTNSAEMRPGLAQFLLPPRFPLTRALKPLTFVCQTPALPSSGSDLPPSPHTGVGGSSVTPRLLYCPSSMRKRGRRRRPHYGEDTGPSLHHLSSRSPGPGSAPLRVGVKAQLVPSSRPLFPLGAVPPTWLSAGGDGGSMQGTPPGLFSGALGSPSFPLGLG